MVTLPDKNKLNPDVAAIIIPEYLPKDFLEFNPERWNKFFFESEKTITFLHRLLQEKIKTQTFTFDQKIQVIKMMPWLHNDYRETLINEMIKELISLEQLQSILEIAYKSSLDDRLIALQLKKRSNIPYEFWINCLKNRSRIFCQKVIIEKTIESATNLRDLITPSAENHKYAKLLMEKIPELKIQSIPLIQWDQIETELPIKSETWMIFATIRAKQRSANNHKLL